MNNGRLQFFKLVKAMREAQREYYSTRSHEALRKALSLERSVDAYIKRGDDYLEAAAKRGQSSSLETTSESRFGEDKKNKIKDQIYPVMTDKSKT